MGGVFDRDGLDFLLALSVFAALAGLFVYAGGFFCDFRYFTNEAYIKTSSRS